MDNKLAYALLGGIAAGIISILFNTAIAFLNTPTFQRAATEGNNLQQGTAYALVGLQCLNFFIILLTCFIGGYVIGKMTTQRRLGLYTGALAGIITYVGSFLVRYIPNYPGNLAGGTTSPALAAGGILLSLVFLLIWAGLGGLLGFWGASAATRKRPTYMSSPQPRQ